MEDVGIGNLGDWGEAQGAKIERELESLSNKIAALDREIEELGEEKKRMKRSLEEENDPEVDAGFPRLVKKGMTRVSNKQEELRKKREELVTTREKLEGQELRLKAVMGHERFQELVELKKKRDAAAEEVTRLEAEMNKLMERMIRETSEK